jgi:hypothetical protein
MLLALGCRSPLRTLPGRDWTTRDFLRVPAIDHPVSHVTQCIANRQGSCHRKVTILCNLRLDSCVSNDGELLRAVRGRLSPGARHGTADSEVDNWRSECTWVKRRPHKAILLVSAIACKLRRASARMMPIRCRPTDVRTYNPSTYVEQLSLEAGCQLKP